MEEAEELVRQWMAGEREPTPTEFGILREVLGDEMFYEHFGDLPLRLPEEGGRNA